jgi:hypothetical protein
MAAEQNLNGNPYSQSSHGASPSSSNTSSGNESPGPGDGGGTAPQASGSQGDGGTSTSNQGAGPFDVNAGVDGGNLVDIQAGSGTDGNPAETSIAASVTDFADINANALGDDAFANVSANAGNLIDADAGVIDDGNILALNADVDDVVSINASVSDDVGGNLLPGDLDPGGLIPGDVIPGGLVPGVPDLGDTAGGVLGNDGIVITAEASDTAATVGAVHDNNLLEVDAGTDNDLVGALATADATSGADGSLLHVEVPADGLDGGGDVGGLISQLSGGDVPGLDLIPLDTITG